MKGLSKVSLDHLVELPPPVFRYKYDMIFALPFCMVQTPVVFHVSFGVVALSGSHTKRTGKLHDKSNSESLPGKAGGFPIGL